MSSPRRIVCLTEETTEVLYALGEQDRIVGVSAFTVRPPEARHDKPVVSQFIEADLDAIEALDPDLVLGFSDLQANICADLIRRGLSVHCFNQRSIAGILDMIRTLGRLIERGDAGNGLADDLSRSIDAARTVGGALSVAPRVFFEEWPDPIITGIHWVSELIEVAGGVDCFADLRGRSLAKDRIVTPEVVLERKPDLYFASWCGRKFRADNARSRLGFADAPFTRDGRMLEIPSSIILQPGPAALTDGLRAVQAEVRRVALELAEAAERAHSARK